MRTILCPAALAVLLLAACSSNKFPVRTYPLAEKVVLGSLTYTAFDTQWLTHLGDGPAPRLPQDRFFLVRVNIANSGGTEAMAPALTIVDDRGKVYEELNNGEGAPLWIGYLRQIRPGGSVQGNLLFDAPLRHYKLRITDENGERAGLIDIPLSFSADAPDVLHPADKGAPPDLFKK